MGGVAAEGVVPVEGTVPLAPFLLEKEKGKKKHECMHICMKIRKRPQNSKPKSGATQQESRCRSARV